MPGPLHCGLLAQAPLLPKLRGYFAEFLDNASPVGLGILSPSTCVGLRYGHILYNSGFSRHMTCPLRYFSSLRVTGKLPGVIYSPALPRLPRSFLSRAGYRHMRPRSSEKMWYRNLHLLSIGYGSPPRLRPRLTQGRSASPWNPWIFGHEDSHLILATHSGILPRCSSTAPSGTASMKHRRSPTACSLLHTQSFGDAFQPRTFSARGLSTSELLRTL